MTPINPFRKLPIGIQEFEKLRTEGYLYVDKTAFVYELVSTGAAYFLSRPRRFGKSLLLSTFKAYFEGKKELFKGLAIDSLETEWNVHPVLHLSLNAEKYESAEHLEGILEAHLQKWEEMYGTNPGTSTFATRFMAVLENARKKTGHGAVVLIDEYDKPLLQTYHDEALQNSFRSTLTAFYTVLKDADPYLKFVFITGVTKFAQVGVFSTLNHLDDISISWRSTYLCGLTREEIESTFGPELNALGEASGLTYSETMAKLTRQYDGYRFMEKAKEGVFNPFSVLKTFKDLDFKNYWFATGTPSFLIYMLRKTNYDLRDLDGIQVSAASLTDYRVDFQEPVPVIYQSGYLTIKGYDERFMLYTLGFPNEEVKYGFLNFVTPLYTPVSSANAPFYIGQFTNELWAGQTESFLNRLRAFFADFPYELNTKTERHYQVVFYLVFKLMGQFTQAAVQSAQGRADAVVQTPDYIYVFEFKLDGSAEEALRQINSKGYLIPYTADHRKLVKVGVSFNHETRNIGEWITEE